VPPDLLDAIGRFSTELALVTVTSLIALSVALGRLRLLLKFQERHSERLAGDLKDEKSRAESQARVIDDQIGRLETQASMIASYREQLAKMGPPRFPTPPRTVAVSDPPAAFSPVTPLRPMPPVKAVPRATSPESPPDPSRPPKPSSSEPRRPSPPGGPGAPLKGGPPRPGRR